MLYFLTPLLDPEAEDGVSEPKDGGDGLLPAAQPLSPLSLNLVTVALQDVSAASERDQCEEEPQSVSGSAGWTTNTLFAGSNTNQCEEPTRGRRT